MKIAIMMRAMDQDSGFRAYVEGLIDALLRLDHTNAYLLLYRTPKWLGRFAAAGNVHEPDRECGRREAGGSRPQRRLGTDEPDEQPSERRPEDERHAEHGFVDAVGPLEPEARALRGFREHRRVADLLSDPASTDITAGVDLSAIARHVRSLGWRAFEPVTQASALAALGHDRWERTMREMQSDLERSGRGSEAVRVWETRSRASLLVDASGFGAFWWLGIRGRGALLPRPALVAGAMDFHAKMSVSDRRVPPAVSRVRQHHRSRIGQERCLADLPRGAAGVPPLVDSEQTLTCRNEKSAVHGFL